MVMRYWGARDVYPDDFSSLVDRSAGGIHTSALVGALEARAWTAVAGPGDMTELAREVGRGRPVIALVEDRPGRYHYVVVLAAGGTEVVLHDPARAPSRRMESAKFDAAWQKSQRWMLLLLPKLPPPAEHSAPTPSGVGSRFYNGE
jgi:ABC-type bacteriocin/lantibiotic exporter with double-glycine peptidase domain